MLIAFLPNSFIILSPLNQAQEIMVNNILSHLHTNNCTLAYKLCKQLFILLDIMSTELKNSKKKIRIFNLSLLLDSCLRKRQNNLRDWTMEEGGCWSSFCLWNMIERSWLSIELYSVNLVMVEFYYWSSNRQALSVQCWIKV